MYLLAGHMGRWEDIIYRKKGKARDTGQSGGGGELSAGKGGSLM